MSQNTEQPNPVDRSEAAAASSANSRINIPLNLDNWKTLDERVQNTLLWFHQHLLDEGITIAQAAELIDYDGSNVFRVLKGTYEGNWQNIVKAINAYKASVTGIQQTEFVRTPNTDLIWSALDYAMANNSMTLIVGESGFGKTFAAEAWRDAHNHGRSVMVTAPSVGGVKGLLRTICAAVGANKNGSIDYSFEAILRAFNANRCLIIDEAIRLLPLDERSHPVKLDLVRDIHDRTKCAVGMIATQRFDDTSRKLVYQYEQVLGRSMKVRMFRRLDEKQFRPIIEQYIPRPSNGTIELAEAICNETAGGRIRVLVEILKLASRIASKSKTRITEEHFKKAHALRRQMMGEINHAAK